MSEDLALESVPTVQDRIAAAQQKTGRQVLTAEDLLILAAAEISRTYTYDEKGYV